MFNTLKPLLGLKDLLRSLRIFIKTNYQIKENTLVPWNEIKSKDLKNILRTDGYWNLRFNNRFRILMLKNDALNNFVHLEIFPPTIYLIWNTLDGKTSVYIQF